MVCGGLESLIASMPACMCVPLEPCGVVMSVSESRDKSSVRREEGSKPGCGGCTTREHVPKMHVPLPVDDPPTPDRSRDGLGRYRATVDRDTVRITRCDDDHANEPFNLSGTEHAVR
jgi:hypothetical protein